MASSLSVFEQVDPSHPNKLLYVHLIILHTQLIALWKLLDELVFTLWYVLKPDYIAYALCTHARPSSLKHKHLRVHVSSVDKGHDVTERPGSRRRWQPVRARWLNIILTWGHDGERQMQRWEGRRQDKWQARTGSQFLWRQPGRHTQSPLEQGSDSTPQGLQITFLQPNSPLLSPHTSDTVTAI